MCLFCLESAPMLLTMVGPPPPLFPLSIVRFIRFLPDLRSTLSSGIKQQQVDDESGWWFGKVGTEIGLFPSNFVESIVGK